MTNCSANWSDAHRRTPTLADTLQGFLPDAPERLLLLVALGGRERAAAAWQDLKQIYPNHRVPLVDARDELRRFLPLLHSALVENNLESARETLAAMSVAAVWEKKRAARIAGFLAEIVPALRQANISPILLKGFGLAGTVYPNVALRHCHDLDLLVTEDELARAATALAPLGFVLASEQRDRRAALSLVHHDGFVASFHTKLVTAPFYRLPQAEMVSRAAPAMVAGTTVRVLSPPDMLVHVCAQVAAGSARGRTNWVPDAATLLIRAALSDSDWDRVIALSVSGGIALPLFTMLRYLAQEIGVPVPPQALARLGKHAARSRAMEYDAALDALRRSPEGRVGSMFERSNWRSRLQIVRFIVMPSPSYLKSWCTERGLDWTPAWYVARPLRHLAFLARNAWRRGITAQPKQQHAE